MEWIHSGELTISSVIGNQVVTLPTHTATLMSASKPPKMTMRYEILFTKLRCLMFFASK